MYRITVSVLLAICLDLNLPVNASKGRPASQNPHALQRVQIPDSVPHDSSRQADHGNLPANSDKLALTDGTPVRLRFVRPVVSSQAIAGEKMALEVVEPVLAGNLIAIPQRGYAEAIVTLAQARRSMGRGGNLQLKIESVRLADGELVPVRAVKDVKGGGHQSVALTGAAGMAAGMAYWPVSPVGFLVYIKGKSATIPAGAEITAYRHLCYQQHDTHLNEPHLGTSFG